jgi:hypothetical protein
MKAKLGLLAIGLISGLISVAQSKLDTLINLRKTDFLDGKLPTYYTPGYKDIATVLQKNITDAINYYENKTSKQFQVKLVVLDTTQWLKEIYPYGYILYSNGWVVMNTGMTYDKFINVYGAQTFYTQLDKELKKNKTTKEDMILSFFKVYSIHELGHYFISRLSNAKSPDRWTNESVATYFAYEFFTHNNQSDLKRFEMFHKVDRDYYNPRLSSIKDLNEIYGAMGIENYLWYHSNFFFLVKSLYNCKGDNFISYYEDLFPKGTTEKLSTDRIISLLDRDCGGIVNKWVQDIESKTKK